MVYARTLSLSRLLVIRLVCSVFYHHLEASLLFPILVGIQCFLFDHHREASLLFPNLDKHKDLLRAVLCLVYVFTTT